VIFPVLAAFTLWLALTGSSEASLMVLGIILSVFLGRLCSVVLPWRKVLHFAAEIAKALVQAYVEAFTLIFSGDLRRGYVTARVPEASPWRIFKRVFLVTLTPKTIAIHVDHMGEMLIHRVEKEDGK